MLRPNRSTIKLKSARELDQMRRSGAVVAEALAKVRSLAAPGATTAQLNDAVVEIFQKYDATPLFLNYPSPTKGVAPFPAVICASKNATIVHGVPDDVPLEPGDVISVDTGCRMSGWCGDSAITIPIGAISEEDEKLLRVTKETLDLAIRSMRRCQFWSEVAGLMERYVKSQGMYVIEKFVGHGIGRDMHEEPQVPNFVNSALRRNDIRLEPGLVLAIEPMVALGTKHVKTLADGWTVNTKDGRAAAHFEHTVAMTAQGPRVLTLPDGVDALPEHESSANQ